jgi:DnaA family protein
MTGAIRQLPLALKLRQGKDFAGFVGAAADLLPLLQSLAAGEGGQVYLYGEAGTGKSHLLEAAVAEVERQGGRACLLSAPLLKELPPSALAGMEAGIRLLALDDVDAVAGRPEWEEALFHLYNRCQQERVALLFAARHPPRQAGFGLPDLMTRLGAGPVVSLSLPDDAGLMRLLQQQARARGLDVGEELAQFLLKRAPRQPAALAQLMDKLDQAALADGRRLSIPFVKQCLGW